MRLNQIKSLIFRALALALAFALAAPQLNANGAPPPTPKPIVDSDITLKLEYFGTFPNDRYDGETAKANMGSPAAHYWRLFGIDQRGSIYRWSYLLNQPVEIFNKEDHVPAGLNLATYPPPGYPSAPGLPDNTVEQVLNVAGGPNPFKVYVMFSAHNEPSGILNRTYLPQGQIEDLYLDFGFFVLDLKDIDIFNIGLTGTPPDPGIPPGLPFLPGPGGAAFYQFQYYQVLYEYTIFFGKLINPRPIVALHAQATTLHNGGGMVVAPNGKIIFGAGDYIPAGAGGRSAPQQITHTINKGTEDEEEVINAVGKILIIDPQTGEIEIAAKGVRNPQRLQIVSTDEGEVVLFSELGRTLAEEINAIPLDELLDTSTIENFGWGCDQSDANGKCDALSQSREGTFYIAQGDFYGPGPLDPVSLGEATKPEPGFIQPLAQYNRFTEGRSVAGITGPVASKKSFDQLSFVFGDLDSGRVYGITSDASLDDIDAQVVRVNLVDKNGTPLLAADKDSGELFPSLNALVPECGGTFSDPCRVDPRFFTFPSGKAGVLLEKTGEMYRLIEVQDDD